MDKRLVTGVEELWEAEYRLSPFGQFFHLESGKEVQQYLSVDGNPFVWLTVAGERRCICVHSAVAKKWLGLPRKRYVRHLDGDKGNNDVRNLCWSDVADYRKNQLYGIEKKLQGKKHKVYVGVYWNEVMLLWGVKKKVGRKLVHVGYYDSDVLANQAYLDYGVGKN